jgi:hypothetical protein|tara:strand:- start:851 stop:1198 length:348 start_codon:yes stop_codon:yes gene_type:complete
MNRIEPILSKINATMDTEDQMIMIMEALNDTVTPIPDVGGFYTYIYNAKTPNIKYDQHPLIACVEVFRWGFRGANFHLNEYRNYTWEELPGQLYIVQREELDDLISIQYGKIIAK